MLTRMAAVAAGRRYWLGVLVFALALEATALFYQHVLEYGPCVLCIHVRIWVLGLVLAGLSGLGLRRFWLARLAVQALTLIVAAGLTERGWQLLAVETGRAQGECSFDLGLPAWLALDRWFPPLFQVQEACGYTPLLPLGVSMAEALVPVGAVLVLVNLALLLASLLRGREI